MAYTPTAPTVDYDVTIDSYIATERIDYEYSQQIIAQRESSFPFTAFMIKVSMQKALTSVIYWFDTRPEPDTDTVVTGCAANANIGSTGTNGVTGRSSIVVTAPKYYKPKQVLEFPTATPGTGETNKAIVISVDTGTSTIVMSPLDPTKKMCAVLAGAAVNIMYSSYEQGSTTTKPSSARPIRGSNSSTILRDSYQVAKTTENERMFGAPERALKRGEKEIKHLIDLNKLLLFGDAVSGDDTYFSNRRTVTKGFENFVTTNVFSYGAELTSTKLFDYMTIMHENAYGASGDMNKRLVFCSSKFMSAINKMQLSGIRWTSIPTSWGVSITRIEWSGWQWDLVQDPTLTKFRQGAAFVMQPRYITYKPFRPTQFRPNIQNPENDYIKDEYLTEPNLEFRLEEVHGIIKA